MLESQVPLSFGGGDDGSPPKDPAKFYKYLDQEVGVHFTHPDHGFRLPNVKAGGKQMYHFVEYDPDGGEVGSRQHSFGTWHNGRHIWISWTFSSLTPPVRSSICVKAKQSPDDMAESRTMPDWP